MQQARNLLILIVLLTCNFSIAQDGMLDPVFDFDGKITDSFAEVGEDLCVQPDGKILVVGSLNNGSTGFVIARYNVDGSIDESFNSSGTQSIVIGTSAYATCIQLQDNGKIIIGGFAELGGFDEFAIARLNSDGTLDNSFNLNGIVTTSISSKDDRARGMSIQTDGKIVVTGESYRESSTGGADRYDFATVRYNLDGSLDNSFNNSGIVTLSLGTGSESYDVETLNDGSIVTIGEAWMSNANDFALVKHKSDGTIDSTFGTDGIVTTPIFSGEDRGRSLDVQSDGKIIASGFTHNGNNYDFAIVRYNSSGVIDNTFGINGIVATDLSSENDFLNGACIQSDDKIILVGRSYTGQGYDFSVVRYNPNGSIDNSFGTNGIVYTPFTDFDRANSVKISVNGKIVVCGETRDENSNEYLAVSVYNNPSIINSANIELKIFLEGAYTNNLMGTNLTNDIPLSQPYNDQQWSYNGAENTDLNFLTANDIVDWVYIELRKGNSPENATTIIGKRAALLNNNGIVIDLDGSSDIEFNNVIESEFYIAVFHRNHIPVMTSQSVIVN